MSRLVVELGTFVGYGTLRLARALKRTKLKHNGPLFGIDLRADMMNHGTHGTMLILHLWHRNVNFKYFFIMMYDVRVNRCESIYEDTTKLFTAWIWKASSWSPTFGFWGKVWNWLQWIQMSWPMPSPVVSMNKQVYGSRFPWRPISPTMCSRRGLSSWTGIELDDFCGGEVNTTVSFRRSQLFNPAGAEREAEEDRFPVSRHRFA